MKAERVVAAVLGVVGACSLGIFAWAVHRAVFVRGLNPGDAAMSVFALFGALCLVLAWQLILASPSVVPQRTSEAEAKPTKRVSISRVCAAIGVVLMMLAVLLPEAWHPVVFLFLGIAFLAVSHVLTPCVERLEQLKKARESMRQL